MIRRAHRARLRARMAEGVLLFLAATLVLSAAAIASGAAFPKPESCGLAALGAMALALAWVVEHGVEPRRLVAELDAEHGFEGALLTAYQVEQEPDPGPLGELLVERVRARLQPARLCACRSRAPHAFALVLVVGAALVFQALEGRPSDVEFRGRVGPMVQRLAGEVGAARDAAFEAEADLTSAALEELVQLARDAGEVGAAGGGSDGDSASDPEVARQAAGLAPRLDAMQDAFADCPEVVACLQRAEALARAAALADGVPKGEQEGATDQATAALPSPEASEPVAQAESGSEPHAGEPGSPADPAGERAPAGPEGTSVSGSDAAGGGASPAGSSGSPPTGPAGGSSLAVGADGPGVSLPSDVPQPGAQRSVGAALPLPVPPAYRDLRSAWGERLRARAEAHR